MRFLSLFAGIGGFDLGLERAGWVCAGQVEIDPFAQLVLAKHWPSIPRWADVRELEAADVVARAGRPDAIVGGFPCQDVSFAGRGAGIRDGTRSGLWAEFSRLLGELRPRWAIVENVPALRKRGADLVLGDLEALGYTCRPALVGADAVGSPQKRQRVFVIANLADTQRQGEPGRREIGHLAGQAGAAEGQGIQRQRVRHTLDHCSADVAWPAPPGAEQHRWEPARSVERGLGGSVDGIPTGLARWDLRALKGLGNAVVPQVAEAIGRAILEADRWS
jgi:DNA (cytosine-5)-methyltransferase 1